ncbi:type II secretion system F family protein [Nocardioides sp. BP30]|uniref:type II secretion system F family protein n=1 Tax=Nocardioides sp. BP30 TaxID=3036374 RepID=UPI0024686ACA|nr:type II secretion system F family protein [Nocardioides sp. BP30]WGL52824.1 type II secretion system F family protein [Nocardioides sp. BP30]
MNPSTWWQLWGAAGCAALAAALAQRPPRRLRSDRWIPEVRESGPDVDWNHRWRWLLAASAGVGAWAFLGGPLGLVAVPVAATLTWTTAGRAEPAATRRARERSVRELPHVVRLLGLALDAGAPPAQALEIVADALPGPASDRLRPVAVRLRLGADPAAGWAALGQDAALAPLGRTLGRAQEGGLSVAEAVARLADDLARQAHATAERRARAVGVRAAAPLGLCLLPAFLLIGIVPLVGGLLTSLSW